MPDPHPSYRSFTRDDYDEIFTSRRNWNRWGADDQLGALNLIDSAKRRQAVALVQTGELISLSRPYPKDIDDANPRPALHFLQATEHDVVDFYGISYHGIQSTHIDALCHVWGSEGMWNGRDPQESLDAKGAKWGDIDQWRNGIVTRGVLLDVPRYRGVGFVDQEHPVHGDELAAIAEAQGTPLQPGDAMVVYSGRDAWTRANGYEWGSGPRLGRSLGPLDRDPRPGLHASCLEFIRDSDCALMAWDMMDLLPNGLGVVHSVHAAIFMFGIALVDNVLLEPLANACGAAGRYEFMFTVAPLRVAGGTGSPVNPIVML